MSGCLFLTAGITFMIPETRGRTLEEIERGVLYGSEVESESERTELSVDDERSGGDHFEKGFKGGSEVKGGRDVVKEVR